MQEVAEFNVVLIPNQNASFDRMLRAIAASRLWHVIQALTVTTEPLLASNVSLPGKSSAVLAKALPDNQWELELRYWHSCCDGPAAANSTSMDYWAICCRTTGDALLTSANGVTRYLVLQKPSCPIGHLPSFSVVAIVLIVVCVTLVTIASLFVEHLAALVRKCLRKSAPNEHWDYDDMLDLRRYTLKARWRPPPLPKDDRYCPASRRCEPRGSLGSNTTASVAVDAALPSQTHPSTEAICLPVCQ